MPFLPLQSMIRRCKSTLVLLIFAFILPETAGAQAPVYNDSWGSLGGGDGQFDTPSLMAAGAANGEIHDRVQLSPGSRTRVKIAGKWVVRKYLGQSGDSLRFLVPGYDEMPPFPNQFSGVTPASRKLPTGRTDTLVCSRSSVEEFQVSRGHKSHGKTGALVGVVVGGGAGLALGLALASDELFQAGPGAVVGTTVLGAGAGCLLGGIIGTLVRTERWETVPPPSVSIGQVETETKFAIAFTIPFP